MGPARGVLAGRVVVPPGDVHCLENLYQSIGATSSPGCWNLPEGPRSCQEAFKDLIKSVFQHLLALSASQAWSRLQGDAGSLLCAGSNLTLSQEDPPKA